MAEEKIIVATSVFEALGFVPKATNKKAPTSQINSINNKGLVEVVFDQTMFALANSTQMINPYVLKISIIPSYEGVYDPEAMLINWEVVAMTSKRLVIQLVLDDPIKVSAYQQMDNIEVEFLVPYYFFSTES